MKKVLMMSMLFALGIMITTKAQAQGDPKAGKANFALCVSCHGPNGEGNKALNAPVIAGQEEWYLARQLQNFKAGARAYHKDDLYGAQMRPMAGTLVDDKAVNNVAAYVASLPAPKSPATITTGNAANGKTLFAVCSSCHGPDAKGNKAMNAPKLLGQHDWYLARQLNNFKLGIRGTNPKDAFGAQMRPMAMTLANEQAVNDVVAYITSLK